MLIGTSKEEKEGCVHMQGPYEIPSLRIPSDESEGLTIQILHHPGRARHF